MPAALKSASRVLTEVKHHFQGQLFMKLAGYAYIENEVGGELFC